MIKIIKEDFSSIHQMLNVINSRPNNHIMRGCNSSSTESYEFTGTHSYDEAVDLITNGYVEILPKVKSGIKKLEKKLESEFQNVNKIRPYIKVNGFTPHVPNSILNLPNSMIDIERHSQKQKTLDIIYAMGACCVEDKQLFIDAGVVLLTAIKILELNRISVRLKVSFKFSVDDRYNLDNSELVFPTILLKNYGQRLDLQKLCFPLANPSMFRRFGFKWLETLPEIKHEEWNSGYGYSCAGGGELWEQCIAKLNLDSKQKMIRAQDIREMKFEVKPLLDKLLNRHA